MVDDTCRLKTGSRRRHNLGLITIRVRVRVRVIATQAHSVQESEVSAVFEY